MDPSVKCWRLPLWAPKGLIVEFASRILYASSLLVFREIRGVQMDYAMLCFQTSLVVFSAPLAVRNQAIDGLWKTLRGEMPWIALRSLLGIVSFGGYMWAVQFIPASDVTALHKCNPVIMTLLACCFFRERPRPITYLFLFLSVVGIFLISRPSFLFAASDVSSTARLAGSLLAIASCTSNSLSYVVQTKITKTSVHMVALITGFLPVFIFLPLSIARGSWTSLNCPKAYLITVCALIGYCGYLLRLLSVKDESVGRIALMTIADLPYVFIVEVVFFGHRPPWTSYVGGIIVAACAVSAIVTKPKSR